MQTIPIPFNEPARLRALKTLPHLHNIDEPVFRNICEAARELLGCPVGQVSVIEEETHHAGAIVGMELDTVPRAQSFCSYTIMSDAPLIVPDMTADPRFADHPLVTGGPEVRFYAGAPVVLASGFRIGSLCVLDSVTHAAPGPTEIATLRHLAGAVAAALERGPAPVAEPAPAAHDGQAEFLALVGHELRTPLTSLTGYLGILEARAQGSESRLLRSAARGATHLAGLVERLLTYANSDTGELRLDEAPASLEKVIDDVLLIQGPGIEGLKKTVTRGSLAVPGPVMLDRVQMETALSALLENAALHGGAELTVSASTDSDGNVVIEIADDGQMTSRLTLEELFRPFTVGEDLDTRRVGGLGLGLPLTRKIIELHGGELSVEARADRTVGRLRLPAWRLETTTGTAA